MISFPSTQELTELQKFNEPFCLTAYARPADPNSTLDSKRIEIKNLLRDAEKALISAGVDPQDVKKIVKPAKMLLEDREFLVMYHEGLVLFMHPKLFRYYYIPGHTSPYRVTVETGFNLDPLLKVMQDNQSYYVLALGHKNVQLFEGDRYGLNPVFLKDFPSDMKRALNIDEYPQSRETHTVAPTGKGSEAYHEQYNVSQTDKAMLLEFFRRIDRRLHDVLTTNQRPLIIAGVDYVISIYRKVNTYSSLLNTSISGNQDRVDLVTLRDKAWSIVEESRS